MMNLNEYFTAEELASNVCLEADLESTSVGNGTVTLSLVVEETDDEGQPVGEYVIYDDVNNERRRTKDLDEAYEIYEDMIEEAEEAEREAYENFLDKMSIMRASYRW